jgi:hypothetical protein
MGPSLGTGRRPIHLSLCPLCHPVVHSSVGESVGRSIRPTVRRFVHRHHEDGDAMTMAVTILIISVIATIQIHLSSLPIISRNHHDHNDHAPS